MKPIYKFLGTVFLALALAIAAYAWLAYEPKNQTTENTEYNTPNPNPNTNGSNQNITKQYVLLDVPFTSQAPTGNWSDPRQQDGCEEASLLMAWFWLSNTSLSGRDAEEKILDIAEFEKKNYNNYINTSPEDTTKLMREYFGHQKIAIKRKITATDIKLELEQGRLVLIPAYGKALNNPNFTNGGPVHHMLVIRGFDEKKKEFITNDPGTRKGEGYKYSYNTIMNAIFDYQTGSDHDNYFDTDTVILVVSK